MKQEDFINMLEIDEKGHYPFQCWVELENGEAHLIAMCLGYIQEVYQTINTYLEKGVKIIHFSADFPKSKALPMDFVGIHTYQNEKWSCVLLPYDTKGNKQDLVTQGEQQELLLKQVISHCSVVPSSV